MQLFEQERHSSPLLLLLLAQVVSLSVMLRSSIENIYMYDAILMALCLEKVFRRLGLGACFFHYYYY
jgi:hypothetical protein